MAWTKMPSGFLRRRFGVARRLDDERQDRGPAFGLCELAVLEGPLDPGDAETVVGARMTLETSTETWVRPDLAEGIVGAGVVVERERAAIGVKS